jgi:hypothetical protein
MLRIVAEALRLVLLLGRTTHGYHRDHPGSHENVGAVAQPKAPSNGCPGWDMAASLQLVGRPDYTII